MAEIKRYTIGALAANKSGVLSRITGLFTRRGYNIESLTACDTENPEYSRMTIVLKGDEYTLYQMIKQMDKLEDVIKVGCADEFDSVCRELMLAKVSAKPEIRSQLIEICEIYKAKVVDFSRETLILEITGTPSKLNAFVKIIEPYGILEMQRTGVIALARGENTLK
ncbi:MAG: acetolactate synthase small subunit [Clostridia bacterium]|nr:acetolactate synthase small subunit [Clostridia bacterium]